MRLEEKNNFSQTIIFNIFKVWAAVFLLVLYLATTYSPICQMLKLIANTISCLLNN